MNLITLNDKNIKDDLWPFTLTRSILDIRIGILTLREKWELLSGSKIEIDDKAPSLPANIIPTPTTIESWNNHDKRFILSSENKITYAWDILKINQDQIKEDFAIITKGKISKPIPSTNKIIAAENIFVEEGAKIEFAMLNASGGPIYIGKNAEVMEGSLIRGPFALCQNSVVKMGTRIYGATTVGKNCVVGGEIKNSLIGDYSNKAHDGYLGDSMIGEWCNIGAGTSNSNIKNTGSDVMVWNDPAKQFINAGQKCGLIMGDYSRCAINTSFNTGTIAGVCSNIFGDGLTPKLIPSFSWGFGESTYEFEKAIEDIRRWKKLKDQSLSDSEIQVLKHIFEQAKSNNK